MAQFFLRFTCQIKHFLVRLFRIQPPSLPNSYIFYESLAFNLERANCQNDICINFAILVLWPTCLILECIDLVLHCDTFSSGRVRNKQNKRTPTEGRQQIIRSRYIWHFKSTIQEIYTLNKSDLTFTKC